MSEEYLLTIVAWVVSVVVVVFIVCGICVISCVFRFMKNEEQLPDYYRESY